MKDNAGYETSYVALQLLAVVLDTMLNCFVVQVNSTGVGFNVNQNDSRQY